MNIEKFHYWILLIALILLFLSLSFTLTSLKLKTKYDGMKEKDIIVLNQSEKKLTVSRIFLVLGLALSFAWFYFKII